MLTLSPLTLSNLTVKSLVLMLLRYGFTPVWSSLGSTMIDPTSSSRDELCQHLKTVVYVYQLLPGTVLSSIPTLFVEAIVLTWLIK